MNQIIIDTNIRESKVAIVENDELVELYIEQHKNKKITGNIYKGKVVNVLPGMQAAFVDIGTNKNAFLYVKDAISKEMLSDKSINLKELDIKDVVKAGQDIVVQVVKESIGSKGPKVTKHITLSGKYTVLMPYSDYIGISTKIKNDEKRERLRNLAQKYRPKDIGVIMRTCSEDIDDEELKLDIEILVESLDTIENNKNLGIGSKLIYKEPDLVEKIVRDFVGKRTDKIIVNNKDDYENIKKLLKKISLQNDLDIEYIEDTHDMFGHFNLDNQIKIALDREVHLKSGGYLVIDETEALTAIDINTGKYIGDTSLGNTVLNTNLEATVEIAKQLRLRNIGGIIIIDFIDMKNKKDNVKVLNKLKSELKKDRTKTTVYGMTKLGLVEMTRKKEEKSLRDNLLTNCPYCSGSGVVLSEDFVLSKIEKEVKRAKYHTSSESIIFKVNPTIVEYIKKQDKDYTNGIKKEYNIEVHFIEDDSIHFGDVKIFKLGSKEFIKNIIDKYIKN